MTRRAYRVLGWGAALLVGVLFWLLVVWALILLGGVTPT